MAPTSSRLGDRDSTLIEGLARVGLARDVISALVSESLVVRYEKGSRPFLKGSPADDLMVILSGTVKVYCPQSNARRFLAQLAGPGDVIGFSDFVDHKGDRRQIFEAEALTTCSAALLSRHRITKYLRQLDSEKLVGLIEQFNSFWSGVAARYTALMSLSYRERLELVLAEVAQRFGVEDARGILLRLEFSHEDWAEMVGCSRPMIGRIFAEMEQARVLQHDGKHYILLNDGALKSAHTSDSFDSNGFTDGFAAPLRAGPRNGTER